MIVVVDTNVLVSALLSPHHPPARIIDLILAGEIEVAFDDRLLAEYREGTWRPKFKFDRRAVEDLLDAFYHLGVATMSLPLQGLALPDPDDMPFLEVAVAAQAILVSGNVRHFPPEQRAGVPVLSPAEFLERWS